MNYRKTAAFAAALALTISAVSCGSSSDSSSSSKTEATTSAETTAEATAETTTEAATEPATEAAAPAPSLSASNRKVRTEEKPMGEDGTWTVFAYLCGADLESAGGAATNDIIEMSSATENSNVRFVVQIGGSTKWAVDSFNANACERYIIQNGDAEKVYEGSEVDMGESSSLSDFLKWGIGEYPAAHMGLILWDHGSGSINGVCFDEKHEKSSLLLKEIDAALYSVYDDMTDRFEFIGFDACLMGTAETAAVMATHARYMIGSEELEPGCGWNYTAIGNYLAEHPDCGGDELGKEICDSYYKHCEDISQESSVTLTLFDLSNMDNFISAFDSFSKELYEASEDPAVLADLARNISAVDNFGGNGRNVGFTNMVDMGGLINAGKDICPSAQDALDELENTVLYSIKGKEHSGASGMSLYYPLQVSGSSELSIFKDVALSSYYLGLVDKIAYGFANNGEIEGYDNSALVESSEASWTPDAYTFADGEYSYAPSSNEWTYLENANNECTFTFEIPPTIDEDHSMYGFALTQESLQKTAYAEAAVFIFNEADNELYQLGISGDVNSDLETGQFVDNFNGTWFALPDGQLLPAYLYEKSDNCCVYAAPVLRNDEVTFLRFADITDGDEHQIILIDYWDGIDEDGAAARAGMEITAGDVITPIYISTSLEDESESEHLGDEYVITEDTAITLNALSDGIYFYSFIIDDIFGNYYEADPVAIYMEEGTIVYITLDEINKME